MTAAALDRLIAREEALVDALDGQDVGQLERAAEALRHAVTETAASGAWRDGPEIRGRLVQAMRLAEAACRRLNYLADRNRRQLARLAALTGAPMHHAYGRSGRLS